MLMGLRTFARRSPLSTFWGVIAALIVIMAISAPAISPYPPLKSDFRSMSKPPSEKHWFGTDQIGRDTLARVIHGSRASLTVMPARLSDFSLRSPCRCSSSVSLN